MDARPCRRWLPVIPLFALLLLASPAAAQSVEVLIIDRVENAPLSEAVLRRLDRLERLVHAVEEELGDDEIDDEQRLQNIGERLAGVET